MNTQTLSLGHALRRLARGVGSDERLEVSDERGKQKGDLRSLMSLRIKVKGERGADERFRIRLRYMESTPSASLVAPVSGGQLPCGVLR